MTVTYWVVVTVTVAVACALTFALLRAAMFVVDAVAAGEWAREVDGGAAPFEDEEPRRYEPP